MKTILIVIFLILSVHSVEPDEILADQKLEMLQELLEKN